MCFVGGVCVLLFHVSCFTHAMIYVFTSVCFAIVSCFVFSSVVALFEHFAFSHRSALSAFSVLSAFLFALSAFD